MVPVCLTATAEMGYDGRSRPAASEGVPPMSLEMMKSILTTIVLVLAIGQAIAGLRLRGHLKFLPLPIRYLRSWHRWGGDATLLLTLGVALICATRFSYGTYSLRVILHAALGTLAATVMFMKVVVTRRLRRYLRYTLVLGTIAGFSVLGCFMTSALWYSCLLW
ncbi:MAG: hypothetical protein CEE40_09985 [Chloroflexi bacterium B3_Chlor]|nr:MAG: hypothetical protein CEE40_09985 [Chloroflexi bacterium B3_Chlor]